MALEPCFTYSIGFRAPRAAELATAFLDWLHERGFADGTYRDPGLRPATRLGQIPAELIGFASRSLEKIRWNRQEVGDFVGRYLTTPKQHVVFRPRRGAPGSGVARLDPKTQLLYLGKRFFLNGESFSAPPRAAEALQGLADKRASSTATLTRAGLKEQLAEWYRMGYLSVDRA